MTGGAESVRGAGGGSLGAASAQLTGISAQHERFRAQVASGRFEIDPRAEKAARAYEKARQRMSRSLRGAASLERFRG